MPANDNELNLIDAAIIKFKGYLEGKNDFDELDFKEAITDYATRQRIDELEQEYEGFHASLVNQSAEFQFIMQPIMDVIRKRKEAYRAQLAALQDKTSVTRQ